jgi:AraC family transcriptional regulator of adaptative response / DNA-3-methyladenine glycosylase II
VCRARLAARDRCKFFDRAIEAEHAGFRACFRCRPELAPNLAPTTAVSSLARAAATRIESGALNDGSVADLARELGVSSRHVRRAIQRELGVSPVELAQFHRLALAKKLLHDTAMPIVEVAYASGFASVRRFNATFRAHFGRAPTDVRRKRDAGSRDDAIELLLTYRTPFAWRAMLEFLAVRAVAGVEVVDLRALTYARTVELDDCAGFIVAAVGEPRNIMRVRVSRTLARHLMDVAVRIRALFDLDANPSVIDQHLARAASLRSHVHAVPGMRVPGAFDGFEVAVRAVLAQQIRLSVATRLVGRFVHSLGSAVDTPIAGLSLTFPTADRVAKARGIRVAGLTSARAHAVTSIAKAIVRDRMLLHGAVDAAATIARLRAIDGVGDWTADYIAMRALAVPDVLPTMDRALQSKSAPWSPWRSYAAMHLWHGGLA